jgi:hypothetical protein
MDSYLYLTICKSYASPLFEWQIGPYNCERLRVLSLDLGVLFFPRFKALENLCSVGKHLVCEGGQFVLFEVPQGPQLLSYFILVFCLYGGPFTLLNKVDFREFD